MSRIVLIVLATVWLSHTAAAEPVLRQAVPEVYAISGASLVPAPGELIENGTIVVRDGIIEALGVTVDIPADAWRYEYDPEQSDVRIYPGLIDSYVPVKFDPQKGAEDSDNDEKSMRLAPGRYPHPLIHSERLLNSSVWPEDRIEALRRAGFTSAVLAPESGLVRGHSALVNLGEGGLAANLVEPALFQHFSLQARTSGRDFPNSLMGSVALLRQALSDARWQLAARQAWQRQPGQARPEFLEGLGALEAVLDRTVTPVFEAADALDSLRIAAVAGEYDLRPWMVGHGREYQRLDALSRSGLGQILPLDFPDAPDVDQHERDISLPELRHWKLAPQNPARVMESGLPVVFTAHPHSTPETLFKHLARALEHGGLDPDLALAALTTGPAELLGIADRAGRLAPGYMANFVVVEGELLVESPAIQEVWVDGRRNVLTALKPPEIEPAGSWEISLIIEGMGTIPGQLHLEGQASALSGQLEVMGTPVPLAQVQVSGSRLNVRIDGARMGMPGSISFYLDIEGERGRGSGSSPQGSFDVRARRSTGPDTMEGRA